MTVADTYRFTPALATEIAALNDKQREAVTHRGELAVLAGPGSGKTRTLVAKIGFLLTSEIGPHQGLAAMTYTRRAAAEITARLGRLGLQPGRRLDSATAHAWCLAAIVRPYSELAGGRLSGVIGGAEAKDLLQRCLAEAGLAGARGPAPDLARIRRAVALGHRVDGYDPRLVSAAVAFDEALSSSELLDHDSMVSRALHIVRTDRRIARLVTARYPWLVVDEYQDMSPVLHTLVTALREDAGAKVVAVGDPDQTIMGFTGADRRYLLEFADRKDVHTVVLQLNYRHGSAIIAASQAALGERRDHRPSRGRQDPGTLEIIPVKGGLDEHARAVVQQLHGLREAGVPSHDVAILYPRKGQLLTELMNALDNASLPYVHERDDRLPDAPIVDFLRAAAARSIAGPQPIGWPDQPGETGIRTIGELADDYDRMRSDSGLPLSQGFRVIRLLTDLLDLPGRPAIDEMKLGPWLRSLSSTLDLDAIAVRSVDQRNTNALRELLVFADDRGLAVRDLATHDLPRGKLVVTTYHSAKGREWPVVLLPGLVDGVVPYRRRIRRTRAWSLPTVDDLRKARRELYVAISRARRAAILLHGPGWQDRYEFVELGPSRFIPAIEASLLR